jgi:hypothetical protein
MHWNPWCNSQQLCCHCLRCWLPCGSRTITCVSFNHIQFHLLTSQHCAYQRWHSHLSWWVDIVLTKDDIHILVDIVIADPMWTFSRPQSCITQGFATSNVTQAKERIYCNWHPINQFLHLTIEIFDYVHKHADVFLHDYVNVIWSLKRSKGPHLSTLVTFVHQKILITLQKMQASFVLSWAIVISLTTS